MEGGIMLEKNVVKQVRKIALANNFKPYFIQPVAGSQGVPDALLISPMGNTIHLELKGDSELRAAQKVFLSISNCAWEVRYDKKKKKVLVILDKADDDKVELGLFLAVRATLEQTEAKYKRGLLDFLRKAEADKIYTHRMALAYNLKDNLFEEE